MLLARLDELRGLQRGEISVVAGEGFIDEVSRNLSFAFCRRYPDINLKLEQVGSYDVIPMVLRDEAHIGISYCAPAGGAIRVLRARRLPVGLVAWPDHPLVKAGGPIALSDVLPYRVALMREQFGVRKLLTAAEYADRIQFTPHFTSNSLAVLKNHVKARMAVTFMSARAVAREVAAGELATVRIENAVMESAEIQLIVRAGRVPSAALVQVQRCLGELPLFAADA
ncbi:LysR substrate-binding domain-containing protein [Burkholderia sp. 3C]